MLLNRNVRRKLDGSRRLGVGSTYLGYPHELASDRAEVEPFISDPLLSVFELHQTVPSLVLQASGRRGK